MSKSAIQNTGKIQPNDNKGLIDYCDFLKETYEPNKKILLVQIPQMNLNSFNPEVAKKRGYYAFPPTGLQYLHESLKERDLQIEILDLNFLLLKKVAQEKYFNPENIINLFDDCLESFNPYVIGISCMFDSAISLLIKFLDHLKQINRHVIITGGVIASYELEKLLKRGLCHFVIRGEGENKINYLFDRLTEENRKNTPTPGIYYQHENELHESAGKPDVVDFSGDLIESYSLVPIEEYNKYGSLNPFSRIADNIALSRFTAIQMARGCRGVCSFCSVRDFMGKGVRKRPVNEIIREMEFLINKKGVRHFEWLDDDLLFYKTDFMGLLKTIIDRKWKITWSANNGIIAKSIDSKTLQLMRDSGCIGFKVGIETGNPEILKSIRKPARLDDFRKLGDLLDDYPEIFIGGNFIIGFPDETFQCMMDSFLFYLELNLDWGAFTICQAIRGATAFNDLEDYFDSQFDSNGEDINNFIPVRESIDGKISVMNNIYKNMDVFDIDADVIPDEHQTKEIWFTFNLVGNFINNKNLKRGGKVRKFISWVEMAQAAYPVNPYMCLFLSLAYIIDNNQEKAEEYFNKTVEHVNTEYWKERFTAFSLMGVINNFPENNEDVFAVMDYLCQSTSDLLLAERSVI